ncbi:MAG: NAD(P)H-dependent oxidoreductase subunit E [Deltaproteobacteria bacterium]|nr:NAD(P)H-dependent oxidoreductase subunit E [Deltaproteobacteria bacterium]
MDDLTGELLREILSFYRGHKSELIPILLEVQTNFGYLPKEAILLVADFLNLPEGHIYAVASFYRRLRLLPLGKQRVTVCRGTACHIHGGPHILREVEKAMGIKEGETSSDLEYTLDTVACVGCCALAPCLTVKGQVHGAMTVDKVKELFSAARSGGRGDQ